MLIYPAIDLIDGCCVRLAQGRFDAPTIYPADPVEALAGFAAAGASWAHVVDLEGARAGEPRQHDLIGALAKGDGPKLQVAGGFRSRDHLVRMFDAGIARVVIGSLAVTAPDRVKALLEEFGPDRIALAFDVRLIDGAPVIATSGWLETSSSNLWEAASFYPQARHLLVTDISRDGMLSGPNVALMDEIVRRLPRLELQASGGVAWLDDIRKLGRAGAAGAIVGKALWEGRFGLAEAIDAGR
jgi:phosphoribosylformimino-5-aminoimidazole carboxamide ribotide isomerase